MSILNIKQDHTNYRAKIVKIDNLQKHPNADKLKIAVVDFQRVIVGLNTEIGDLFVYFPLESQINAEFLSFVNGFSDSELNNDKEQKGFFSKKRRVKATRLRGELSEGYLHPVYSLNSFLLSKGIDFNITESHVGVEFDSIGDLEFCTKYIVPVLSSNNNQKKDKTIKVVDRLIDGQLRLHKDTDALKKNIHKINPEDFISVSYKIHGTNFTFAKVLCKKKLSLFEKILSKFGINIVNTEYDWCAASRRVVKSIEDNKSKNHYYDYDLWSEAMHGIKESIQDGITLYGEIAGFLPSGSYIQKDFDYGCVPGKYRIYIFRITYTNPTGKVFEFSRPQIERYCSKYELEPAPLFYYGRAKDMYPEIDTNEHWHENFLNRLISDYTEKDCFICRNKVPEEGIVIIPEKEDWNGFKLKSLRFLEKETQELNCEQSNIEDQ